MIKVIYSDSRFSIEDGPGLIGGNLNDENIINSETLKTTMDYVKSKGFEINSKVYIRERSDMFYKKKKHFEECVAYTILSFEYIIDYDKLSVNIKDRYGFIRNLKIEHVISKEQRRSSIINDIINE